MSMTENWPHAGSTRHRTTLRRLARLGFLACVLAVAFLAFAPFPESPGFDWDKANHLVAFVTLMALAELGWPDRRAMPWRLGLVLGYGVLIELVQAQLPYRQGSVLDLVADALGVALYLVLKRASLMLSAWGVCARVIRHLK
jgi:VanZ family protein